MAQPHEPRESPREIRIPNEATYAPLPLLDVMAAAPLASRLLLGATLPGRVIQLAAMGVYARSVAQDWTARREMRRVDFKADFGADVDQLESQPRTSREMEVRHLGTLLNQGWTEERPGRHAVARQVNEVLTDFLETLTGQRVETSAELRDVSLAGIVFPFAQGTCDVLSGDVTIIQDTGIFEPHVIAHEFVHRKGYWKELHAQVLAYMALRSSGDPVLVQAVRAERLYRQIRVLAGDDARAFDGYLDEAGVRDEIRNAFRRLRPPEGGTRSVVVEGMRKLYDLRMRATGQNGLSDYDEGFTDFLHTFRFSETARQPVELAAA